MPPAAAPTTPPATAEPAVPPANPPTTAPVAPPRAAPANALSSRAVWQPANALAAATTSKILRILYTLSSATRERQNPSHTQPPPITRTARNAAMTFPAQQQVVRSLVPASSRGGTRI